MYVLVVTDIYIRNNLFYCIRLKCECGWSIIFLLTVIESSRPPSISDFRLVIDFNLPSIHGILMDHQRNCHVVPPKSGDLVENHGDISAMFSPKDGDVVDAEDAPLWDSSPNL